MSTHNLKTWMPFYQDVIEGCKTFELRKNDRDYQVGDILNLIEVDPSYELALTGRQTNKEVVYLLTGWGLQQGYVVLAIK
ncbi:ASCH/PUA domain-containing protein [Nostoc sp.]